jgi:DNA-directed RNA polymerase specialized sigma24 family protein
MLSLDGITRFLNQVTVKICLDQRKKMNVREAHEDRLKYHIRSMEKDDIEIAEATAHQQMLIRQKIARIPGKCGKVCHMRWIQKMSEEDIAITMGMSGKTVENHLSAGITFLKITRKQPSRNFAYPLIIFILIYIYEKI